MTIGAEFQARQLGLLTFADLLNNMQAQIAPQEDALLALTRKTQADAVAVDESAAATGTLSRCL